MEDNNSKKGKINLKTRLGQEKRIKQAGIIFISLLCQLTLNRDIKVSENSLGL